MKTQEVELESGRAEIVVYLRGTDLLMHAWSRKALAQMYGKLLKTAKQGRPKRDFDEDFRASVYWIDEDTGRFGYPCTGFKNACVRAGKNLGMVMTDLRTYFYVERDAVWTTPVPYGEGKMRRDVVELYGPLEPHHDIVRVKGGGTDVRVRGLVEAWYARLRVSYRPNQISPDQLVSLIDYAGFGVGIGDWRPEKDGTHGRFQISTEQEFTKWLHLREAA